MAKRILFSVALTLWAGLSTLVHAAELVMVEQKGCAYCIEWERVIGPIYPKTPEGAFAPLRQIDLDAPMPADLSFSRKVTYTPTFVLVENGAELGRIEGYPGEDFFWGLLNMLLESKTDFVAKESTNG